VFFRIWNPGPHPRTTIIEKKVISIYKMNEILLQLDDWNNGKKEINLGSVVILLTKIIQLVDKIKIDSVSKKELSLEILNFMIKKYTDKNELIIFLESTAPILIDTMVSIAKRKIILKRRYSLFC
jgi:hypothetical protein